MVDLCLLLNSLWQRMVVPAKTFKTKVLGSLGFDFVCCFMLCFSKAVKGCPVLWKMAFNCHSTDRHMSQMSLVSSPQLSFTGVLIWIPRVF